MRLILWDVDGTLLRAGPVASRIFGEAVATVTGRDPGRHGVSMSGKTDPQIATEVLATVGLEGAAAHQCVPAVLDELVTGLSDHLDRVRSEGRRMPGVVDLLGELATRHGVHQTLLTGNVAANARSKTAALSLDGWFDWRLGAFGDDHADRLELVPVARRRATTLLGAEPERIWVVGDTPNDAACARAGGASCVLVATGHYGRAELEGLGADAVVDDLADTPRLADLLTS